MAPQLPAPPRPPAEPERVASGAGASAPTGAGGSRLKTACMMFQVGAIHCVILSLFLTRAPLPTAPLFLPFLAHSTPPLVNLVPSPTQEGRCTPQELRAKRAANKRKLTFMLFFHSSNRMLRFLNSSSGFTTRAPGIIVAERYEKMRKERCEKDKTSIENNSTGWGEVSDHSLSAWNFPSLTSMMKRQSSSNMALCCLNSNRREATKSARDISPRVTGLGGAAVGFRT